MEMEAVIFDLDDTLYKEVDYLKSAFREIARRLYAEYGIAEVYDLMLSAYSENVNVFEFVNNLYGLSIPMDWYLHIYREHIPEIELDVGVRSVLDCLKSSGVGLGLITDGRSVSQRNKINSLKLDEYFQENCIVISEEFGSEKNNPDNFSHFEKMFPDSLCFYVGDNLNKDFVIPNQRKWISVCLLDDGRNVYKQDFDLDVKFLPAHRINYLSELTDIVGSFYKKKYE